VLVAANGQMVLGLPFDEIVLTLRATPHGDVNLRLMRGGKRPSMDSLVQKLQQIVADENAGTGLEYTVVLHRRKRAAAAGMPPSPSRSQARRPEEAEQQGAETEQYPALGLNLTVSGGRFIADPRAPSGEFVPQHGVLVGSASAGFSGGGAGAGLSVGPLPFPKLVMTGGRRPAAGAAGGAARAAGGGGAGNAAQPQPQPVVEPGDVLLSIDGRSISDMPPAAVVALLRESTGFRFGSDGTAPAGAVPESTPAPAVPTATRLRFQRATSRTSVLEQLYRCGAPAAAAAGAGAGANSASEQSDTQQHLMQQLRRTASRLEPQHLHHMIAELEGMLDVRLLQQQALQHRDSAAGGYGSGYGYDSSATSEAEFELLDNQCAKVHARAVAWWWSWWFCYCLPAVHVAVRSDAPPPPTHPPHRM
jgi:hypothetical protein